jgi:cell division initiation protein
MEVSPKTLREVEFREKMRGYHPEDVDQFLERVAAGLEVLQDRLRQAIERAQRAEQAATEAGGNDDALRRTLLLAQRTADLAVQEGREQAARLVTTAEQQAQSIVGEAEQRVQSVVGDAQQRAQALLADAERRAQSLVSEAEQRARRGHEDAIVQVRAELAKLEATRERLNAEVDTMTRWVNEHRGQLRAALEEALTRIEQIDVSPPAAAPSTQAARPGPATFDARPADGGTTTSRGPDVRPASATAPVATPTPAPTPASAPGPAAPNAPAGRPTPDPSWGAPVNRPSAQPTSAQPEDAAWAPEDKESEGDDASRTDPYFAQLRRAITDQDPLGPRPDGDPRGSTGGAGPRTDG